MYPDCDVGADRPYPILLSPTPPIQIKHFANMESISNSIVPIVATAASVGLATAGLWFLTNKRGRNKNTNEEPSGPRSIPARPTPPPANTTIFSSKDSSSASGLKNVWDAPRNLTSREKVAHSKAKKFSSSYYYAHNNPNATGGYKDGLKMEDYTMNQPRLLSKGGKPVHVEYINDKGNDDRGEEQFEDKVADSPTTTVLPSSSLSSSSLKTIKPIRQITKYLWDDPGDDKGVATIRIDCLPHWNDSTQMLDYKECFEEMVSVQASLVGGGDEKANENRPAVKGLKIQLESSRAYYELYIPKLFGDVTSVKTISKPQKLLIKLTKTRNAATNKGLLFASSSRKDKNLDAWPHPGRKV